MGRGKAAGAHGIAVDVVVGLRRHQRQRMQDAGPSIVVREARLHQPPSRRAPITTCCFTSPKAFRRFVEFKTLFRRRHPTPP